MDFSGMALSTFQRTKCIAGGRWWFVVLNLGRDDHGWLVLAVPCDEDGEVPLPSEPVRLIRVVEAEQPGYNPKTKTPTSEEAGVTEGALKAPSD